jgi:hypothetical protein
MIPLVPPVPVMPAFEVPAVPFAPPRANIPSHPSLYIPPASELKQSTPNPKVKEAAGSEEQPSKRGSPPIVRPQTPPLDLPEEKKPDPSAAELAKVTIPIINMDMPVPRAEIVSTAAVTSGVSVGAAMSAQAILKRLQSIFKPVIKAVIKKINKLRNKPNYTWSRKRLKDRYLRGQGTSAK